MQRTSKYLDSVLITVKKLNVERWTLLTLSGHHLAYVVEGKGPPPYENGGQGCSDPNRLRKLSLISP